MQSRNRKEKGGQQGWGERSCRVPGEFERTLLDALRYGKDGKLEPAESSSSLGRVWATPVLGPTSSLHTLREDGRLHKSALRPLVVKKG